MRTSKKVFAAAAALAVALGAAACSGKTDSTGSAAPSTEAAGDKPVIGIALPQKTSENWVLAEKLFNDGLTEAGFSPLVQFANAGTQEQQNQIEAMITQNAKVIVVGAIDGSQLGTQLKAAKEANIPVIAYDRLLTNTADVDYYIAYDNFKVGELQGQALLEGMKKRKPAGPYTIEVFAGSPDDANSQKFFDGAMSVLQPAIDKGDVKVGSGQAKFAEAAIQGWKSENAQRRMDALLTGSYAGDTVPDGVLSPNDTLARAILTSVKQAGKELPVVTGQDSEVESVKLIVSGEQYSTINKDTRKLVNDTIKMIQAVVKGDKPEINDDKSYQNGVKVVPAQLLTPLIVTKANVKEAYADDPTLAKIVEEATK